MKLSSIFIELDWEENLGVFEGPVDHVEGDFMFSFELRLTVEGDDIFESMGSPDILIEDFLVQDKKGKDVTHLFDIEDVKDALTWY